MNTFNQQADFVGNTVNTVALVFALSIVLQSLSIIRIIIS